MLRRVAAAARRAGAAPPAPRRASSSTALGAWATMDPQAWSAANPHTVDNIVRGVWTPTAEYESVVDPMNGEAFLRVAKTQQPETAPFLESLAACPKTGLHNPLRSPERYRMLADVSLRAADALRAPETFDFFSRLVQRTSPKSWAQAQAEVRITRQFLENFTGDNVRYLARSFGVPGDHLGQESHGHRFPFGPVAIITPFNFPIEIPALQVSYLAADDAAGAAGARSSWRCSHCRSGVARGVYRPHACSPACTPHLGAPCSLSAPSHLAASTAWLAHSSARVAVPARPARPPVPPRSWVPCTWATSRL